MVLLNVYYILTYIFSRGFELELVIKNTNVEEIFHFHPSIFSVFLASKDYRPLVIVLISYGHDQTF